MLPLNCAQRCRNILDRYLHVLVSYKMWFWEKRYYWALHSLSSSIHDTFFSMFDNGKIDVSDCYSKFVLLYIWPLKCIIFKTFLWNITGKGVTGTIFELELTYDALVHVFWEVTETLGHYFTRKHLFSGYKSTSYTQVKAVIYFCLYFSHFK